MRYDVILILTARYLLLAYLAFFALTQLDVFAVEFGFRIRLLFWVTLITGATAVFIRYRPHVRTAVRHGIRLRRRLASGEHVRLLSAVTRNFTIVFFAFVAVDYIIYPVFDHVDPRTFYRLLLVMLSATILVRDDPVVRVGAKGGAVLFVAGLLLGRFSAFAPSAVPFDSLAFGGLLVGVTMLGERERLGMFARSSDALDGNWYRVGLAVLTGLAAVVYFYRLGFRHLHGDEHQVVAAAAGFYHTGEFYLWDWVASEPTSTVYDRAWPHTVLIAASYALFGISEWSSRLPSALAGVVTVPISYYVFRYFFERRRTAFVMSASLVLYPALIGLFRWTRMYALLIPLFLSLTYLAVRVTTERNTVDFGDRRVNAFVERYADFNVCLGLLTLPLFLLATQVHRNTFFLLPAVYLFTIYQYHDTRERKYLVGAVAGTIGLLALTLQATFTDHLTFLTTFISPFARDNTVYVEYLFRYPVPSGLGVILFLAGFISLYLRPEETRRPEMVYLYLLCGFSLVFLVFIGDRYASFVYIVHVVPVGIALVTSAYVMFADALGRRWLTYGLLGMLLIGIVGPLFAGTPVDGYRTRYYEDPQDFSEAYDTIERNYDEGEVVFAQYPRKYYLQDLDENAVFVDMRSHQRYTSEEFARDVSRYDSGWLVWSSKKSYHVHPTIRAYSEEHFVKLHGWGVDDTGVEVYYYNESMTDEPVSG